MNELPELNHWWDYPIKDIMTCAYWSQHQLPPSNKKIYTEELNKLKKNLIKKYGNKPKGDNLIKVTQ